MADDWRKCAAEEQKKMLVELSRKFKTSLVGPGRFIGIDDLCGTLVTRDKLPPGTIFEGTIIYIDEPIETLLGGGALEITIKKRIENTLSGQAKKD